MSETRNLFTYEPLNDSLQEIRLLSIRTEIESTDVEYRLEPTSLVDGSTYEALSYTWGDISDSSLIILNDQPFSITQNLAKALQHLRKETEDVKLWVDAICINQKDIEERNKQLSRMKDIYENAKRVIVWLGEESDDSGYAMSVMNNVDERWAKRSMQYGDQGGPIEPDLDDRARRALDALLSRPWWRRVWIIQEITCSKDNSLKCGRYETKFIKAVAVANLRTQQIIRGASTYFSNPDITIFHRVIALDGIRLTRKYQSHNSDFLSLCEESRNCEASDPRDKVFALSGFATAAQKRALNPDCSMRLEEVYVRFTVAFIEAENNLNILGHCQALLATPQSYLKFKLLSRHLLPRRCLPSWTPDWTMNLEATPFMKNVLPKDTSSEKLYKASGNYVPSIQLAEDLGVLFVRGCMFDRVLELGEGFDFELSPQKLQLWRSLALAKLQNGYQTPETIHEAFLHTLVADIGLADRRPVRGFPARWPVQIGEDTEEAFVSNSLLKQALHSRRFFISELGFMGLARYDVKEGDNICILHGGGVPFILRPDGEYHLFRGECFVHGLMDGEAMRYPKVWQDFGLK